jgi:hypothetical protein
MTNLPQTVRRPARLGAAALLLALMSGCTGGAAATAGRSPSPSTSSAASPSSTANQMVIAISDWRREHVTLYRVTQDRVAHKLRTIDAEPGFGLVLSVTMTDAADPLTCVVHSTDTVDGSEDRLQTRCYPLNDQHGYELPLGQENIALSRDGSRVLSLTGIQVGDPAPPRMLYLNQLHDHTSTQVADASADDTPDPCAGVMDVAWVGEPNIVVECAAVDEDPENTVVQNLDAVISGQALGTGKPLHPTGPLAKGYDWFSAVTPLDATTGVGKMFFNIPCHEGEPCPSHAPWPRTKVVRLDLRTGRVLEVVAVAADDRELGDVSGGGRGIVYETEGNSNDKRVYVRWPGEKHGTRVSGLPSGFFRVTAQT